MRERTRMRKVVVIGGGAAGLGAAFKIARAGEEGHDVTFELVEKDPRLGGKIMSERHEGFVIDGGPDCFLTEKTAVHRVSRLTGKTDDLLPTDDARKKTWILSGGKMHVMPDGIMMFAPTKFFPFVTTGLFSWPGKLRMGMDLFVPRKPELTDETLESFVVRRMGRECLDRLAEPLVGGVHASDPAQMSLMATFPRLLEMEQTYGSLIRGFVAARKKVAEMRRKYPPRPGAKPRTFFTSFVSGMQELTDAMADAAGRDRIRSGVAVSTLHRSDGGWTVDLADGSSLEADGVILATEGWAARELVAPLDAGIAEALAGIPHSSSATVSMGFDADVVDTDVNAFGLLCPIAEGRDLMAVTFSSTKWPGRAPEGKVLMRGFVGGPHNQAVMQESDECIIDTVKREFREILGLTAEPLFARCYRWTRGMPQYTLGHLDRVKLIRERVGGIRGLGIAGGAYTGVGIPNCIESGEAAVSKVLGDLGVKLAEDEAPPEKRAH